MKRPSKTLLLLSMFAIQGIDQTIDAPVPFEYDPALGTNKRSNNRKPKDNGNATTHHCGGTLVYEDRKISRNELCPCGSKKKFKKCHINTDTYPNNRLKKES